MTLQDFIKGLVPISHMRISLSRLMIVAPLVSGLILGVSISTTGAKEIMACLLGALVGIAMSRKFPIALMVLLIFDVFALAALLQDPYRGTHRWLTLLADRFNIVLPLVAGTLVVLAQSPHSWVKVPTLVLTILFLLLQPSFSVAFVLIASQLFCAFHQRRSLRLVMCASALMLIAAVVFANPNRQSRLEAFMDGRSYHTLQIRKTLNSIRAYGRADKQHHLPAAKTDLALLDVSRKLGGATAFLYLLAFVPVGIAILHCLRQPCPDSIAGLGAFVVICLLLNLGVCLSLLPTIGLPPPCLGRGASSWFCFSLLLSCFAAQPKYPKDAHELPA